jgi:hypothetical protein
MLLTTIHVKNSFVIASLILLAACGDNTSSTEQTQNKDSMAAKGTYAYDADFLKKHTGKVIELQAGNRKVLLSADFQGRVMTSSANGDSGLSYGWLNYDLIAAGAHKKQFNPVGGEERFWMGPEGGQYSIYFKKGDSFNVANWQVPAIIDTIPFDVVEQDASKAVFKKNASITNYSGTKFDIEIQRTISLADLDQVKKEFNFEASPEGLQYVAYTTDNQIKNTGAADWKKENGLLSIWLLCMMTPTPQTTAIVPFHASPTARKFITDDYFGKIPAERLQVKDSVIYFTCDGTKRSKIGLSPAIAKPIAGSFDFGHNVLTVIFFAVEKNGLYVNSKWELQKEPYKGDVVNSYNDGPLEDGSQLGPFYEIESSSAAKELKSGEVQQYRQVTCHFQGDYAALTKMAKQLLGVDLNELKK